MTREIRQFEWSLEGCICDESVLCMSGHERSASCLHRIRCNAADDDPPPLRDRCTLSRRPHSDIPKPFLINRNYAETSRLTERLCPTLSSGRLGKQSNLIFYRSLIPRRSRFTLEYLVLLLLLLLSLRLDDAIFSFVFCFLGTFQEILLTSY